MQLHCWPQGRWRIFVVPVGRPGRYPSPDGLPKATQRLTGTTQAVLNAVSFSRFVTELLKGVFKAMNESNQQQLISYIELIRNVANTTDDWASAPPPSNGAQCNRVT